MKPYAITVLCPTSDSFEGDRTCTITLNAGDDDTKPPFIQIDGYMSFDSLAQSTDELTTIISTMYHAWGEMGGITPENLTPFNDGDRLSHAEAARRLRAMTPRTEPPTVEEVWDDDFCLVYIDGACKMWADCTGQRTRELMAEEPDIYTHWLPMPTQPKGGE